MTQGSFFEGKGDVESAKPERFSTAYCHFNALFIHVEGVIRSVQVKRLERGVMHGRGERMVYGAAKYAINRRYCHDRISSSARFSCETLSIPGDARFPVNPYGRILGDMRCPTYP